ncbi:hypothetical protein G5I_05797 [Acromyrmex echinatior]|uniref:Uncharacterized protein n=1 Tax=Acromyrmex echinatior TaxID=103372 RepID=F4WJB9_ACREC|nr:hypothetical protein G5I_05797 [Acromyrmex echinatior]
MNTGLRILTETQAIMQSQRNTHRSTRVIPNCPTARTNCPRLIHHYSNTYRCFLMHIRYRSDVRITKRRDTLGMHEQQWRDEARWASSIEKRNGSMIEDSLRLNHCDDERCSRFGTRRRLSRSDLSDKSSHKRRFWASRVMLRVAVVLYGELAREYVTMKPVASITRVNKRHKCRMKLIAMLDASVSISGSVSSFSLFDEVLYVSSVTSQKMNNENGQFEEAWRMRLLLLSSVSVNTTNRLLLHWQEEKCLFQKAARDAEVDPAQKFSFPAGSGHWNVVLPVHAVASRGFEIPGIKLGLKPGKCEFEMLPPDVRGPDLPSA